MNKILVANRSEIALRVMKTIRKMGLKSVAIYSEADRNAPFVVYADEAVCIGPPPSDESYLKMDAIIEVAQKMGADAIHPGYGFLSENATFAEKIAAANINFIGPGIEAIQTMGSKLKAKEAVKKYDIPMVPGTDQAITDPVAAKEIANEIGYPILIKASAGGGGKGMRVVEHEDDLKSSMERAVSEAESSFGDGSVFIEKYVKAPRHIEIQILADKHGNTLHLFERECSIQRRHQKVVEEAPSIVLDDALREAMGKAAVKVAQSCNYTGAGTVEFLLDEQKQFYFLEMNTRLQVEHPVTECITGIDLVEAQIKIARGEELSFTQDDLKIEGHAIELRVYAEDPDNNFLPSVGLLEEYQIPHQEFIRIDDGYRAKMEVPIYYDPMLSKLIVHGKNRKDAIEKMALAIKSYKISGVKTTLPFGSFVMNHDAFKSGEFDTHFVKNYFTNNEKSMSLDGKAKVAALFAFKILASEKRKLKIPDHQKDAWFSKREI